MKMKQNWHTVAEAAGRRLNAANRQPRREEPEYSPNGHGFYVNHPAAVQNRDPANQQHTAESIRYDGIIGQTRMWTSHDGGN